MRSLQQKLSKKVAFSFFDMMSGYAFKGASNYALSNSMLAVSNAIGGSMVYDVAPNVDVVLLDESGSGRLFGVVLPKIDLPVAVGGEYTLTVELDGATHVLTNPTVANFGRAYGITRPAHFFNCPNAGNSSTPMISCDAAMAAGFGLEYKSKIKITCNYPVYAAGSYYEHAASVVYSKNEHTDTYFDFVDV